jgi:radical SAM superfamily enzyme YgiQ (UPF0313 family)
MSSAKTVIYLADLRHNFGGVLSTDCMPLGVGYMKAVMDQELADEDLDVQVFAYPDELLAAMAERPPHALMVSNYVWNEELSLFALRRARALRPDALTVLGGPNIPVEDERQEAYVAAHAEVDIYCLGEGDFVATDLVRRLLAVDRDRDRVLAGEAPPSCLLRRPDGAVERGEKGGRTKGVDDIPSPWLTGVMDKFFDGQMAPIIETNRGCPFRCSYCVQGTDYYSKVSKFPVDRMAAELDTIGKLIADRSPTMGTLRIADANYGMYEQDLDISEAIATCQAKYGWPTFIDATTGKNRADLIVKSMEKVNGALVLYQAVQSLDEDVLRNIRRSNIRLDAYEEIQMHVRGRGLRSTSDLILGLPGESKESHLTALFKLIDAGTNQAHCFQAMMLKGSDLESLETRAEFGFGSRFRVLPKNFGEYEDERVFDIEEVVVETATLPFDDYISCRKHHLAFSIFWNDSWFTEVTDVLTSRFGIEPSEWLVAMLDGMERDQGAVHRLLDDFVAETRGELFESREACAAFYGDDENFERLRRGEIGDNLMYKYRARASFFEWPDVCACAMEATRRLLDEKGLLDDGLAALWPDLQSWIQARHAHGRSVEEVTHPADVELQHDISRWLTEQGSEPAAAYRLQTPLRLTFELTTEGAEELKRALAVWSDKLTGLTKLVTRIRITSQVRHCALVEAQAS